MTRNLQQRLDAFFAQPSDGERLSDRVEKLISQGYSRARAEQQAAQELELAHMVEADEGVEKEDFE